MLGVCCPQAGLGEQVWSQLQSCRADPLTGRRVGSEGSSTGCCKGKPPAPRPAHPSPPPPGCSQALSEPLSWGFHLCQGRAPNTPSWAPAGAWGARGGGQAQRGSAWPASLGTRLTGTPAGGWDLRLNQAKGVLSALGRWPRMAGGPSRS